jgi:hypothetical protein
MNFKLVDHKVAYLTFPTSEVLRRPRMDVWTAIWHLVDREEWHDIAAQLDMVNWRALQNQVLFQVSEQVRQQ